MLTSTEVDNAPYPRVLVLIDWYLPGYKAGGPIQSVANIVTRLKHKINFSIVTRDTDFRDDVPYSTIQSDQWNEVERNVRICYLSVKNQNRLRLKKYIDPNQYDFIYLNSVFSWQFTILPLLAFKSSSAKFILAPRGMLGEGALEIKSLKKRFFIKLANFFGFFSNVTWQATNEEEKADILAKFGEQANVIIASNIPSPVQDSLTERTKVSGELKLVYLSRISEKKNLLVLLQRLRGLEVKGSISLDLYGPIEDDEYWRKCEDVIRELPDNIIVQNKGSVQPTQIQSILSGYHFFTLLTKHENFGHAIFEALSVGCPLIISDTTPWHKLDSLQIGWEISLQDLDSFAKAIKSALAMGQEEYTNMSKRTHRYALDYASRDLAIEQSLKLFKD